MNVDIAGRLRAEYEYLWHDSMFELPDGWTEPLVVLLEKMYRLSTVGPSNFMTPGIITWCQVRVEVYMSSAIAFASPMMPSHHWHPDRALACIEALSEFHGKTQETCSVCGAEGHLRMRMLGSSREGVYCDLHHLATVEKMDRAMALYTECRLLFPEVHGTAINLDVPDHLFDLLSSTFRSILKVVDRYEALGKVLITRVEMDDGALFVRVRYDLTYAFIGVQMEVNAMIADLETLSDEATRKHNLLRGSDAP